MRSDREIAPPAAADALDALGRSQSLEIFRAMRAARAIDRRISDLGDRLVRGACAPAAGRESISAAAAAALGPDDPAFLSTRDLAFLVMRGIGPESIAAEYAGSPNSAGGGRCLPLGGGFPDAAVAPIFVSAGRRLAVATGAAEGVALAGGDEVVGVLLGDGATARSSEVGAVFEILAAGALPLLVVGLHAEGRPATLAGLARLHGIEVLESPTDDFPEALLALRSACERLRSGRRPVLVDVALRSGDPIERLRGRLLAAGMLDEDLDLEMAETAGSEAAAAFEQAMAQAPAVTDMFAHPGATDGAAAAAERESWRRFGGAYGGALDPGASWLTWQESSGGTTP